MKKPCKNTNLNKIKMMLGFGIKTKQAMLFCRDGKYFLVKKV